jgi:uncharacterized protein (TIGR02145 family)
VKLPAGFSGNYNDLTNKPDLGQYATNEHLNDTLNNYYTQEQIRDTLNNYYTQTQIKDTLSHYLQAGDLCDSIVKCDIVRTLRDSIQIMFDSIGSMHDSIFVNTTNITNNTENITTITNNVNNITTDIHALDSVISARIIRDSTELSNRMDTLLTHVCDSVETCVKGWISDSTRMIVDSLGAYYDTTLMKKAIHDTADVLRGMMTDAANDAKITIQKNGGDVGYFTVNQETDQAINILVPTTVAEMTDASNYVTHTQLNDTLGAYYDTTAVRTVIHDSLGNYLTINGLCDSVKKCDVIKDMQTDITKLQTADNNLSTRIQNDSTNLKDHYYTKTQVDSATNKVRNDICDSATHCMERALANPNSSINNAVDTIAANIAGHAIHDTLVHNVQLTNQGDSLFLRRGGIVDTVKFPAAEMIHDSLGKYVLKTAVRDSITNNVNLTVKNDSLFLTHGNGIDTVPAGKMIKDSIESRVHDGKLAVITHGATKLDTIQKFTANQAGNDTLDLSRYALMDTLHDFYATKAALAESVHKIDSLAGVTSRDSVRLKNHYYTKDEIDTKLHDTTKYALRTALRDTALNIRNDICDSATHCMERALANPNSDINHAIDTIALNSVKDTLDKYVLKTAVRDSITNNVNLTVKHDSLFLTHGKDIDTVPAGKMIKDSIASRVHDGKLAVITHGATKLDTIQKFTANQAGNDTLDLSRYALMDTLHDYYATKAALAESVHKIDSLAGVTSRDSVRLKNHYYTKDEIDTKLHDTTKYALRTALADTARNIRNSVGNGTLSITYGTNDPVTFKANQNTNSSIAIPAPNDGTLTINYGNHTEGTFSANQSGSTVVNIPQYNGGCDSVTFCQLLQMVIDLTNRVNQLEAANCPTLGAVTVSNVTISSATLTATIGNYDPLTVQEFGFLVSASEIIAYDEAIKYRVTSQTAGVFTMDLIGLQPETTYYVRAYALNDAVRCTQSTMLGAQTPWQTNPSVCPTLTKVVVGTTAVEDSVSLSATMSAFSGEVSDLGFLLTTDPDWTTDVDTVHITPVPSSFTETYTLTQGKAGLAYNVPYYFKAYVKPDSTVCAEDIVFGDTAKFMLKDEDFKITVSSDSVCVGDTVTLTAPAGTGYEYQWNTGATTQTIKVAQSKKETKTYTVTVSTPSGNKTVGATVSSIMGPMVLYADSVAVTTLEFYLSENIPGANYVWNKNGVVISGATAYSYTDNNVNFTDAMGSADYYGVTVSLGNCTIKDSVPVKWVANAVRYCGGSTVKDHQGNVYNTVFIDHLCWTRENMRATQYYNGETYVDIIDGTPPDSSSSSYSPYRYSPANGEPNAVNGYLYNWSAAIGNANVATFNDNVYTRGVCPEGWHLPSYNDASYLINVDNSMDYWNHEPPTSSYNPGMLAGAGWRPCCENTVAAGNYSYEYRNITGFSSVPAGRWDFMDEDYTRRYDFGIATFWTCLHNGSEPGASCFFIHDDEDHIEFATIVEGMLYHKGSGMSVRCVLDSSEGHTYPPTVSAVTLSSTAATISMTANVISNGGANVTERGVCWSTSPNPTTSSDHTVAGSAGSGEFTVTGSLTPGITYYVRAYATNSVGTAYGAEVTYLVPNVNPPTVKTGSQFLGLTEGFEGSLSGWGLIDNDGDGKCWSMSNDHHSGSYCVLSRSWNGSALYPDNYLITPDITIPTGVSAVLTFWHKGSNNPSYSDEHFYVKVGNASASTVGDFNTSLWDDYSSSDWAQTTVDLSSFAGQSIRLAFVHNDSDKDYLCVDDIEVSEVNIIKDITDTKATCSGYVSDDGGSTVTARGVCWSTSQNPTVSDSHTTDGTGAGSFTSNITGLTAETIYYVRAYATNSVSTTYGEQVSFTTLRAKPTVTTSAVSNVTVNNTTISATCGGNVTDEGAFAVTTRGVCWSTSQNPTLETVGNNFTTDGSGTGSFTSTITGLTGGTYYVRAYATNSAGTAYGDIVTLTFPVIDDNSCESAPVVTDHEGNMYATVQIGTLCWMRENLRTTTSPKTGTYIVKPARNSAGNVYSSVGSKVAHWPAHDSTNNAPKGYGLLYNWCAAMDTASPTTATATYMEVPTSSNINGNNTSYAFNLSNPHRGICPAGWHVPIYQEWNNLKTTISEAGKLAGGNDWMSSTSATAPGNYGYSYRNDSKFTALPVGKFNNYSFDRATTYAYFWCSMQMSDLTNARCLYMTHSGNTSTISSDGVNQGMSVRCVKD